MRVDDLRGDGAHEERLVEELQRAVDGKDDGEEDRRPDERQLDVPGVLPRGGAIDLRHFAELRWDRLQRGVVDDHVVAGVFPGHDVGEGEEHRPVGEEIRRRQPGPFGQLGEGAERRAVDVPPDKRGDDRRHGVGDEETQPEQPRRVNIAAIEDDSEQQSQTQHRRRLDDAEEEQVGNAAPEVRVAGRLDVVGEADEPPAPHQRIAEHAGVERVDERSDEEGKKQDKERRQKEIGRDHSAEALASPLRRRGSERARCVCYGLHCSGAAPGSA